LFLWIGFILLCISFGIIFFIKIQNTYLINKKEIFLGADFGFFFGAICQSLLLIAVFIPNYFEILLNIGYASASLAIMIFTYFWEKNLVNLKKLPTLITGIILIFTLINLLTATYWSLQLIIQLFWLISLTFFIILFVKFIL